MAKFEITMTKTQRGKRLHTWLNERWTWQYTVGRGRKADFEIWKTNKKTLTNLGYIPSQRWKFRLWRRERGMESFVLCILFNTFDTYKNHDRITCFNQCFKVSQQQKLWKHPISKPSKHDLGLRLKSHTRVWRRMKEECFCWSWSLCPTSRNLSRCITWAHFSFSLLFKTLYIFMSTPWNNSLRVRNRWKAFCGMIHILSCFRLAMNNVSFNAIRPSKVHMETMGPLCNHII